jgi:hypothetical protein
VFEVGLRISGSQRYTSFITFKIQLLIAMFGLGSSVTFGKVSSSSLQLISAVRKKQHKKAIFSTGDFIQLKVKLLLNEKLF